MRDEASRLLVECAQLAQAAATGRTESTGSTESTETELSVPRVPHSVRQLWRRSTSAWSTPIFLTSPFKTDAAIGEENRAASRFNQLLAGTVSHGQVHDSCRGPCCGRHGSQTQIDVRANWGYLLVGQQTLLAETGSPDGTRGFRASWGRIRCVSGAAKPNARRLGQ